MMSIWLYSDKIKGVAEVRYALSLRQCIYCGTGMETLKHYASLSFGYEETITRCCPTCGWWTKHLYSDSTIGEHNYRDISGAAGVLRELDLSDQSIPLDLVRSYLAAKYDARFTVDPYIFENTVASVYEDFGYRAQVTARSRDGGIDVILEGADGVKIGVQVKRYEGKISVEQIRSLAGALYLEGITQGIFVTTSSFQSGAQKLVEKSRLRGIPIELIDAKRFYDALGIAQRKKYESVLDSSAPYFNAPLIDLEFESY